MQETYGAFLKESWRNAISGTILEIPRANPERIKTGIPEIIPSGIREENPKMNY